MKKRIGCQTGSIAKEAHMKTVRLNSFVILLLIPIVAMLANKMPESWVEGPFNHNTTDDFFNDANMVANTLYHNNKTDYYTVWDEDAKKYITYNKNTNVELDTVVFNAPDNSGGSGRVRLINGWNNVAGRTEGPRVVMVNGKVAPSHQLDEEGMRIQEELGCAGCHVM
jgi:hypothetical protein